MPASTLTLIEHGVVPCRRCHKPHDAYHTEGSKLWGSWASLDDGHVYDRMSAEETARFFLFRDNDAAPQFEREDVSPDGGSGA